MRLAMVIALAAGLVAGPGSAGPSAGLDTASLGGWWLVLDPNFERLARLRVAVWQEFVIIDTMGRVEDRAIRLAPLWACQDHGICDAVPLIGKAQLAVDADQLHILDRQEASDNLLHPGIDPLLRKVSFIGWPGVIDVHAGDTSAGDVRTSSGTAAAIRVDQQEPVPTWTMTVMGIDAVELRAPVSDAGPKMMVRIEPDLLRRLWAGFLHSLAVPRSSRIRIGRR